MLDEYGSGRTTKDWAIWPGGAMMKFIPFLLPSSSANSLNKVTKMIKHHIYNKANETVRDLDVVDLFSKKSYLNGKTMHQAILEVQAGKLKGMPVFKNITRKWSRNFLETSYQITSYATLTEEADIAVQSLMSIMQERYGNEALAHFPGISIIESHYHYKNNKEPEMEDPDVIRMLEAIDVSTVDNILAPEYLSILEVTAGRIETEGASTIQLTEAENNESASAQSNKESKASENNNSEGSITTDISILTEETELSIDPDDITVTTGVNTGVSSPEGTEKLVIPKDMSIEEKTKLKREWREASIIRKKLAAINSSHEEVKAW